MNFTTPGVGSTYAAGAGQYGRHRQRNDQRSDGLCQRKRRRFVVSIGGLVTANVALPDPFVGFASSSADSYLSGAFEITGTNNPVDVTFTASLSNSQYLLTDANGLSAYSETIYLAIICRMYSYDPVSVYDSLLILIGPNQSTSTGGSSTPTQTTTIPLTAEYAVLFHLDPGCGGEWVRSPRGPRRQRPGCARACRSWDSRPRLAA